MAATNAPTFTTAASERPASSGGKVLDVLTTHVARGAFAVPFLVFGLFHFANANAMAGIVPVPGGVFWVYVTGAALVAGGLGILLNRLGQWAALGLAALLLTFILGVHLPGLWNPAMQQMSTIGLLKDISLLGGALTWAGLLRAR
jgi:uncharacterized membrane protein YphA (DoxX/SURF4 family)